MIGSRVALAIASVLTMLLLQATLVGPLTFPVPVSLPAVLVAALGIYAGPGGAMSMGFAAGLLADLASHHPAGVLALCWMASGLVGGIIGGLATHRSYGTRPIAVMAAAVATVFTTASVLLLALVSTHGDSAWLAVRDFIPCALGNAIVALLAVPVVRLFLRRQGVRSPRPGYTVIGRAGAQA
jgi:cell shape-determining protein MreD